MQWNHSELEYEYPTHLIPLAITLIEKVRVTLWYVGLNG
jgi:hypothetical protein